MTNLGWAPQADTCGVFCSAEARSQEACCQGQLSRCEADADSFDMRSISNPCLVIRFCRRCSNLCILCAWQHLWVQQATLRMTASSVGYHTRRCCLTESLFAMQKPKAAGEKKPKTATKPKVGQSPTSWTPLPSCVCQCSALTDHCPLLRNEERSVAWVLQPAWVSCASHSASAR